MLFGCLASMPTIYSETVIDVLGIEQTEGFYGEYDIVIDNSTDRSYFDKYCAYKITPNIFDNFEKYFVIHFSWAYDEEPQTKCYTYVGTDWIEEARSTQPVVYYGYNNWITNEFVYKWGGKNAQ